MLTRVVSRLATWLQLNATILPLGRPTNMDREPLSCANIALEHSRRRARRRHGSRIEKVIAMDVAEVRDKSGE